MADDFYKEFKKRVRERLNRPKQTPGMVRPPGANMKNIARGSAGIIKPPEIK